ncbi:hypothetical protein OROMI_006002 [Orobanche minor]
MPAAAEVLWLLFLVYRAATFSGVGASTWCVVRSNANEQDLKTALNYACGAGADCAPIQSSGLCYLPNTFQAHASYAFNSYYQRTGNALGSCNFSGTATTAATDPSFDILMGNPLSGYGSCVYPSSPSKAGGGGTSVPGGTSLGINSPRTTEPPPPPPPPGTTTPLYGGMGPVIPDSPTSNAKLQIIFSCATFLLVFSCVFQTV